MSRHAAVILDAKEIPLLGAPAAQEAAQENCDYCARTFHLSSLCLHNGRLLCPECLEIVTTPL